MTQPNVLQVPVALRAGGRGVCPELSSVLPMGIEGPAIQHAGAQGRVIMQPMLIECLGPACRKWASAPCGQASERKEA